MKKNNNNRSPEKRVRHQTGPLLLIDDCYNRRTPKSGNPTRIIYNKIQQDLILTLERHISTLVLSYLQQSIIALLSRNI